jgi:hypothetical protein
MQKFIELNDDSIEAAIAGEESYIAEQDAEKILDVIEILKKGVWK